VNQRNHEHSGQRDQHPLVLFTLAAFSSPAAGKVKTPGFQQCTPTRERHYHDRIDEMICSEKEGTVVLQIILSNSE
jgi:hypothetical protein